MTFTLYIPGAFILFDVWNILMGFTLGNMIKNIFLSFANDFLYEILINFDKVFLCQFWRHKKLCRSCFQVCINWIYSPITKPQIFNNFLIDLGKKSLGINRVLISKDKKVFLLELFWLLTQKRLYRLVKSIGHWWLVEINFG
jgi:hypothetical protein